MSEIKDEMNRICTVEGVNKITGVEISDYLILAHFTGEK